MGSRHPCKPSAAGVVARPLEHVIDLGSRHDPLGKHPFVEEAFHVTVGKGRRDVEHRARR